ncbi:MAG: PD-(D/E)XK nuclease family protein [Pseudomonadota bacterium]
MNNNNSSLVKNYITLQDLRKKPHLSKSQLNCYLSCSKKYKFRYIDKIASEFISCALLFGVSIHGIIASYLSHIKDTEIKKSLDELLQEFKIQWDNQCLKPIRFTNSNTKESLYETGCKMLEVFYNEFKFSKIVAVELPFCIKIILLDPKGDAQKVNMIGSFDFIEEDQNGKYVIHEFKTAARRWGEGQADIMLDSSVYTYAARSLQEFKDQDRIKIQYNILTKTKSPTLNSQITTRTKEDDKRFVNNLNQILRAIRNCIFYENQSWMCKGCEYNKICNEIT